MPEKLFAIFSNLESERERLQRVFLDAGLIDALVAQPPEGLLYKLELPSEEAVRRLDIAVRLHDFERPIIQRHFDPTPKELRAAPLLSLRVLGPGTERGHPRAGTSYDDRRACAHCGAGLEQTSPLVMRKTELPKSFLAAGAADELLLHETVAEVVERAGLRGIGFREVLDPAGARIPWRQVVVEGTMPPMLASSRGMIRGREGAERPCPVCACDGWFGTWSDPFIPAYPRSVLDTMPDLAWTAERFGTGAWAEPIHGKRSLARRGLIVRPAVYALFKPLKLRSARWQPVRVVD